MVCFRFNRSGGGFFFKNTDASTMGVPAESRTVPETMIAGRCCIGGACANAGVQLAGNKTAKAAKHTVSWRIIDKEFIAGIFTHQQTPCKVGFLGSPSLIGALRKSDPPAP